MTIYDKLTALLPGLHTGTLLGVRFPDVRVWTADEAGKDLACCLNDAVCEYPWEVDDNPYTTFDEDSLHQDLVRLVQDTVGPDVQVKARWGCHEIECWRPTSV